MDDNFDTKQNLLTVPKFAKYSPTKNFTKKIVLSRLQIFFTQQFDTFKIDISIIFSIVMPVADSKKKHS